MKHLSRREFIKTAGALGLSTSVLAGCTSTAESAAVMEFGLVTYLWGKDYPLPELIDICEKANYKAVELRAFHAHGVEVDLSAAERKEVRQRFADSSVTCTGYGSNQEYHSPDPDELKKQIKGTRELIKLCHDIGASGLKVKPNTLPEGVEPEKTIAQIAQSLDMVGKYASDYGQEIRVEVHGRKTSEPKIMKAIYDQVTEPNVKICWNCNQQDLMEPGLDYNFNLLKPWFGDTVHIREMDTDEYPYQELFNLFVGMNYDGYILLEARRDIKPENKLAAMQEQLGIFNDMVANAKA